MSIITKLKKDIITAAVNAGEGHIPSSLSVLDIIWILYDKILNDGDKFILSKGHASLALYSVLAEKGFFDRILLDTFGKRNSILGGHPDRNKVPGVLISAGSLGHGFPISIGIALALKIKKSKFWPPSRVFVLIGDGECNEGTIWESALLASHHNLNNLICIVDNNHSTDRALLVSDIDKKFEKFGWGTWRINGHDHQQIYDSLVHTPWSRPTVIIADTIKGKGCKMMENNSAWHHRIPNENELVQIFESLK